MLYYDFKYGFEYVVKDKNIFVIIKDEGGQLEDIFINNENDLNTMMKYMVKK